MKKFKSSPVLEYFEKEDKKYYTYGQLEDRANLSKRYIVF